MLSMKRNAFSQRSRAIKFHVFAQIVATATGRIFLSNMRAFLVVRLKAILLLFVAVPHAVHFVRGAETDRRPPTLRDVRYGEHDRQVLDFWQAATTGPAPFVLFIHGGGFAVGKKEDLQTSTLKQLLSSGISVVSVNYRYYHQAPLPAALHDCRRALQFVRSRAAEWNLDKSRAGATGGSAGAIASMYLAFHAEMADATSNDPVARESTRLTCVAVTAGQTTLDIKWWAENVPGWPADEGVKADVHAARRWGVVDDIEYRALVADASALHAITPDDPPIWMNYAMAPGDELPADSKQALNWKIHHVAFGVALKKRMDEMGLEASLNYPGSTESGRDSSRNPRYSSLTHFLTSKLVEPMKER